MGYGCRLDNRGWRIERVEARGKEGRDRGGKIEIDGEIDGLDE